MLQRLYQEQGLPIFDRLRIILADFHNLATEIRLNLIHQLHCLNDAENLALFNSLADLNITGRVR